MEIRIPVPIGGVEISDGGNDSLLITIPTETKGTIKAGLYVDIACTVIINPGEIVITS